MDLHMQNYRKGVGSPGIATKKGSCETLWAIFVGDLSLARDQCEPLQRSQTFDIACSRETSVGLNLVPVQIMASRHQRGARLTEAANHESRPFWDPPRPVPYFTMREAASQLL